MLQRRRPRRRWIDVSIVLGVLLLAASIPQALGGRDTWSVLEPEYTPEELASADAGLGGGGDPLIPLGPPEKQVFLPALRLNCPSRQAGACTEIRIQPAHDLQGCAASSSG